MAAERRGPSDRRVQSRLRELLTGEVCSNPIVNVSSLPWAGGVTDTQVTSNPINGISNTIIAASPTAHATADAYSGATLTQAASYYAAPVFYVTDLGANKDPKRTG